MDKLEKLIGKTLELYTDTIPDTIYSTQLYDILEKNIIRIPVPTEDSKNLFLEKGTWIQLKFFNEASKTYAKFSGSVMDIEKEDTLLLYKIQVSTTKCQSEPRRRYFRVPTRVLVKKKFNQDTILCESKDISACGIRVLSDIPIAPGSSLSAEISIEEKIVVVACIVKRIKAVEVDGRLRHEIAMDFTHISHFDEEQLIQYALKEQRKHIYKRK